MTHSPSSPMIVVTNEQVNAAAEVIWNDRDGRMGGPWSSRDAREVCVIQTKATAKAALMAALAPATPAAGDVAEIVRELRNEADSIYRHPDIDGLIARAADALERSSAEIISATRGAEEWARQANDACTLWKAAETRLAEAVEVIQFAHDGYENHNINHVDYRVRVYQACLEFLEGSSAAVGGAR